MKQRSTKIIASLLLLIPIVVAVAPHPAHAFFGFSEDDIFWITAWLSEIEMALAGGLLAIVGSLLNATMTATLHMSTIVNNTPAIGVAWTTIRDFGSVFIIFMLLDVSIRMILGGGESVGKLIKNIVIAGILINFSLFFTKLAVDASNIISLSFYTAIAPTGAGQNSTTSVNNSNSLGGSLVGLVSQAFNDGGLSNVFMQSLDLQGFANSAPAANTLTSSTSTVSQGGISYWNITLANTGGAILMFFAAISFLAATVAFAVRIGVLVLLMAFSPILFIGMIFPDLEQYRKKWSKMLYAMCLFMPVYLLLMYVAMSVLNDPHFFDFAKATTSTTNLTGGVAGSLIGANTIGTVLQYIIAIFLINAPLMAAISIASEGADFVGDMMKKVSKWGQGAISGSQKWAVQRGWRETGGRAANVLANNERFKDIAGNRFLGGLALKATRGVAGSYNENLEKKTKEREKFAESLGHNERKMAAEEATLRAHKTQLAQYNQQLASAKQAAGNNPALWSPAAASAIAILEANIGNTKGDINASEKRALNIDTKRQRRYAQRTKSGLLNRVLRNDAASAKVEISVIKKKIKDTEEDLKENKEGLKRIDGAIKNTNNGAGNDVQLAEKTRLLTKIAEATETINEHKDDIGQLELVK